MEKLYELHLGFRYQNKVSVELLKQFLKRYTVKWQEQISKKHSQIVEELTLNRILTDEERKLEMQLLTDLRIAYVWAKSKIVELHKEKPYRRFFLATESDQKKMLRYIYTMRTGDWKTAKELHWWMNSKGYDMDDIPELYQVRVLDILQQEIESWEVEFF